ncbi:MAG: DUF4238 domain-containing protein [Mesorhizobium sp.]|nr:MAG: DUF4238 domain-containing protein [Mesorhizobium sp.]
MSDTVNHHFIPQFYLRGFSDSVDRRKSQVFVFDQSTKKSFRTLVRNIGARRNFFRIDVEGFHPNHVEDGIAEIESEIAPVRGQHKVTPPQPPPDLDTLPVSSASPRFSGPSCSPGRSPPASAVSSPASEPAMNPAREACGLPSSRAPSRR